MAIIPVRRRNRFARTRGVINSTIAQVVTITDVSADVSNGTAVITFSSQITNLPNWSAGALTFLNNGVARADSAWSLTSSTSITVTIAALAIGQLQVTPGSHGITFAGGGLSPNAAGGGVVA